MILIYGPLFFAVLILLAIGFGGVFYAYPVLALVLIPLYLIIRKMCRVARMIFEGSVLLAEDEAATKTRSRRDRIVDYPQGFPDSLS